MTGRWALALLTLYTLLSGCCEREKIPAYSALLYSNLPKERHQAALSLARCGDAASPAVGRLIELMYDTNVGVQSSAAYALRKIDTPDARAAIEQVETARRSRNR